MSAQPAASAPPILRAGVSTGKFHGVNAATMPTGSVTHQLARALGAARHDAAVAAAALLGIPVDDVGRGDHLGARLGIDLALLLHEHLRDRIVALAHEVGGLAHDLRAVIGRGCPPQRKALFRRFQRLVEVGLARMRQMRQRLLVAGLSTSSPLRPLPLTHLPSI